MWKLWRRGATIEIHTYDLSHVPQLERFSKQFSAIRKMPPESSVWHVWTENATITRKVACSVNGIEAFHLSCRSE